MASFSGCSFSETSFSADPCVVVPGTARFSGCDFSEVSFSTDSCVPVPVVKVPPKGATFWAGFVPPRRKKKRRQEKTVVEVAVLPPNEVKYVQITRTTEPSNAPVMEAVESLTNLLERNSVRSAIIKKKIEEMQEEEDIIVILSLLQ